MLCDQVFLQTIAEKKSQLTAGELSQQFYKKELDQITNRVFLLYLDKNCLMFAFQIS